MIPSQWMLLFERRRTIGVQFLVYSHLLSRFLKKQHSFFSSCLVALHRFFLPVFWRPFCCELWTLPLLMVLLSPHILFPHLLFSSLPPLLNLNTSCSSPPTTLFSLWRYMILEDNRRVCVCVCACVFVSVSVSVCVRVCVCVRCVWCFVHVHVVCSQVCIIPRLHPSSTHLVYISSRSILYFPSVWRSAVQ